MKNELGSTPTGPPGKPC